MREAADGGGYCAGRRAWVDRGELVRAKWELGPGMVHDSGNLEIGKLQIRLNSILISTKVDP